jgi:hypothetical protein
MMKTTHIFAYIISGFVGLASAALIMAASSPRTDMEMGAVFLLAVGVHFSLIMVGMRLSDWAFGE